MGQKNSQLRYFVSQLEEVFLLKVKSAQGSREANNIGGNKRLHSQNSPSGLTPGSKKQKDTLSRKTASLEDSIANLMCLPVTKPDVKDDYSTQSVVKVVSFFVCS